MSGEGPSELPIHYGGQTMDGELIKRPSSPPMPSSPTRAYHQEPRRLNFSPEPVDPVFTDAENIRAGLRRRPSHQTPMRRHSGGEHDFQRPSFSERSSADRRPLRSRDDGYWRDEDRPMSRSRADEWRSHPDLREKSRPPRSYRNVDGWERGPGSASKPYFEESRGDFRGSMDPDLEKGTFGHGAYSPYKRPSMDQTSVDGYDYDGQKKAYYKPSNATTIDFKNLSAEERKEVMRLPWTQWMNSDVKNRKSLQSLSRNSDL